MLRPQPGYIMLMYVCNMLMQRYAFFPWNGAAGTMFFVRRGSVLVQFRGYFFDVGVQGDGFHFAAA